MSNNTVEEYGWASEEGPQSCGYITPRVLNELTALKVRRVLDLGSGNGELSGHLAAKGFDMCGIDFDQAGVNLGRLRHPGVPFYRFGVQDNPADLLALEAPFNAVVSTEVIEHLYSPHLLPAFARAVLAPGGKLLITTPYHGYLKNLALAITNKWDHHHTALWQGGHIKFWSRKTITALLESQGFKVQSFGGVGRAPYLWKSMVVVATRQP